MVKGQIQMGNLLRLSRSKLDKLRIHLKEDSTIRSITGTVLSTSAATYSGNTSAPCTTHLTYRFSRHMS
jgi:hypothetical protein